ncbi:ThuA domain-containing protein [Streptomyces sp. NPDC092296]|uniref:ThuA domain-containing protein n=1 Tax=Streptomyces sp. NPDC092296 TaxID=3366012 RepID=UPI0038088A83
MADLLLYTRTTDYRHDSIPDGVRALRELAADHGLTVEATEDPAAFRPERLAGCGAVVFLSTSGEVLDEPGRAALRQYVGSGGGFVGIHAATTCETGWDWYGGLVGARFAGHPEIQPATLHVEDGDHPATAHLPAGLPWTDEWYDFHTPPRAAGVRVLLTVDESSYQGGSMGADHPIAWCAEYAGGRSFYTALGHSPAHYSDASFRQHLWGGIHYALG